MRTSSRGISRSRNSRLRTFAVAGMLGVLPLALSGCDWRKGAALGWPEGISDQARENYNFWIAAVLAAAVVGAIVFCLLFWTMIFHRKRDTDTELPRQFGYNMPLELVLTVIPFLIIAGLFYYTVIVQNKMTELKKADVVVDVTAFQWNWQFGYREIDGNNLNPPGYEEEYRKMLESKPEGTDHHGKEVVGAIRGHNPEDRSYLKVDKIRTLGTSDEIPVLVVPSGKRVEFDLAAADVVHSFWVPTFLFKRDVMPYPEANHSQSRFQVTNLTEGSYVGRCAEMCGTYHSMMNFEVRVVSPDKFARYIVARQSGKSNAEALVAIGGSPVATVTHPFDTRRGEQVVDPETKK